MELNVNVNTFYKGLDLDSDVSVLEKDTLRYAENIKLVANESGTQAAIQNADYIQKVLIGIPEINQKEIIGVTSAKYHSNGKDKDPVECLVFFTKHKSTACDYVYVLDPNTDKIKEIISGDFKFTPPLSFVDNYESPNISNIYIADGIHELRCINIEKEYGNIVDTTVLDMTPSSYLEPFKFINIGDGGLKAGKYQYAYCLFSKHGSVSKISPLGDIIPLSATMGNENSDKVKGSKPETNTGKSIKVLAFFKNDKFDIIRIYRIFYEITGQLPTVTIVDERSIVTGANMQKYEYTDTTNNSISVTTVDEFQALFSLNIFYPTSLETKDNLLFGSNILENAWDVQFDARAYRADKNGNVVLYKNNGDKKTFSINNIPEIDELHDCINPSNLELYGDDSFKYIYNKDNKLGGTGINISYEFVYTAVNLSNLTVVRSNWSSCDLSLNVKKEPNAAIKTYDSKGNIVHTNNAKGLIRNYSDPYFCSYYTGYHRDEIYRFGIVLFNNKNIASPVHWIGDIRMPSSKTSGTYNTFQSNSNGPSQETPLSDIMGFALGIKFDVKNLPEEVTRYEIVRCARDENNRTVVYQTVVNGLLSGDGTYYKGEWQSLVTYNYNWVNEYSHSGKKSLFSLPLLNSAKCWIAWNNHGGKFDIQKFIIPKQYLELISPEICVSKDNALLLTTGSKLCPIYNLYSYTGREYNLHGNLVKSLGVIPQKIYNIDGSIENNEQNSPFSVGRLLPIWRDYLTAMWLGSPNGQGVTGLFRYTNIDYSAPLKKYSIESAIAPQTTVQIAPLDEAVKVNSATIGEKVYHNISVGSYEQWGWHGENLIVKTTDDVELFQFDENVSDLSPSNMMNKVIVANVKKSAAFVSDSYSNRTNSVYIPCACQFTGNSCICYGGDTYLCVLDYLNTSFNQKSNDYNDQRFSRMHTQCYIPFETTVNTNLFHNTQYHSGLTGIEIGNNLILHVIHVSAGYAQSEPQYEYNTIYSQEGNGIAYISKALYSEDKINRANRIVVSEPKTNLEINDSWLVFKPANYLDVSNKYGSITNLKTFNNRLYYFLNTSLGIASVNDRALVATNTNELVLGTGGVLDRFDYITTTNGTNIINDKSIIVSDTSLYWYDYLKNTLCVHQQGVHELSKLKKVQSHFNSIYDEDRNNSVSLFNKKYNELWFNVANKPLIYNELTGIFTSFSSHNYQYGITLSDRIITISNDSYYNHNDFVDDMKVVEPMTSVFKIVVNDNFMYPKVFDNVIFYADFEGNVNNITELTFKTKNQITEPVSSENIECREDMYRLPIPREKKTDETNNMSYLGRMRGNYIEESYTFDCNDNKTFKIPYIKTTYRQSRL